MVGNWIDEGDESIVISSCKWSADKNFLLQNIEVRREGRDALTIHQRIGWDPVARRIRAWLFDSDGGYGESIWTQDGDHWQLTTTGVQPGRHAVVVPQSAYADRQRLVHVAVDQPCRRYRRSCRRLKSKSSASRPSRRSEDAPLVDRRPCDDTFAPS